MSFVFNVVLGGFEQEEPTLFERREDAEAYAGLFADARVDEEAVMDEGLAASFIAEAEADIEAEDPGFVRHPPTDRRGDG